MADYQIPGIETDDERRRRLELEAQQQAEAMANVPPAAPADPAAAMDAYGNYQPQSSSQTVAAPAAGTTMTMSGAEPAPAAGPAVPAGYNAYTASQESGSGGNANIGYHYPANAQGQRQSTAYGPYGITAPQYAEIQKINPAFAGVPITQLTPEQQGQANQSSYQVYANQLQARGIEPTEANIRKAHLTGAGGLSQYLKTGQANPAQAAANNVSPEQFKQMIEARGAAGVAPASAAAMPAAAPAPAAPAPAAVPTATTAGGEGSVGDIEGNAALRFQSAQNDISKLDEIKRDDTLPLHIRERAADRLYEQVSNARNEEKAKKKIDEMVASGDSKGLANALQGRGARGEEGSWLKMIALSFISPQLAGAEAIKLGLAPTKWESAAIQNADGSTTGVEIHRRADGKVLGGNKMDGSKLSSEELNLAIGLGTGKSTDVSLTPHQAVVNGDIHTISTKRTPQGIMYKDDTAGTGWSYKAPVNMTNLGQQDPGHIKGLTAKNAIETKMRKANADAQLAGGRAFTTEADITAAGNAAYAGIANKPFAGAAAPVAGAPAPAPMPTAPGAPAAVPTAPVAGTLAPAAQPTTAAPAVKSQAQMILDYEAPYPVGPTSPAKIALQNTVRELSAAQNKPYDPNKFKENQKIVNDFTPAGTAGKNLIAVGTAVSHVSDLRPLITALNNGDLTTANQAINSIKKWTGDPNVTNIETVGPAVAAEIAKTFVSTGGGVEEREKLAQAFGTARSPRQLEGAVRMYENLMVGKIDELRRQYERTGRRDFYTNVVTDSRVKEMADRHAVERSVHTGQPLESTTKSGVKYKVLPQ